MTEPSSALPPAFYAVSRTAGRSAVADWWVLLHAPYTLWHLSYVGVGAALSPEFDGLRLTATLLAFFLAVGIGAHALDELHGRPLQTSIPGPALVGVATVSIAGAVILGIAGIQRVGPGLAVFIAVGLILNCGYNLELFGGRLHNDVTFAVAWGAFPVLTAFYAQAETIRPAAVAAAIGAFWLSVAQRALSTPARTLRRRVAMIDGTITYTDGRTESVSRRTLLRPLEIALMTMTVSIVAFAIAFIVYRVDQR